MPIDQSKIERATALAKASGVTRLILFGSALEDAQAAGDLDLACAGVPGWRLYELAARLEDELDVPLDLVPLEPPNRFTRYPEAKGWRLL